MEGEWQEAMCYNFSLLSVEETHVDTRGEGVPKPGSPGDEGALVLAAGGPRDLHQETHVDTRGEGVPKPGSPGDEDVGNPPSGETSTADKFGLPKEFGSKREATKTTKAGFTGFGGSSRDRPNNRSCVKCAELGHIGRDCQSAAGAKTGSVKPYSGEAQSLEDCDLPTQFGSTNRSSKAGFSGFVGSESDRPSNRSFIKAKQPVPLLLSEPAEASKCCHTPDSHQYASANFREMRGIRVDSGFMCTVDPREWKIEDDDNDSDW